MLPQSPRAQRENSFLPRAFLRAKDRSRGAHPKHAKRSGIGPQRALEANTKSPRAPRESRSSQSFLSERRTDPAERQNTPSGAGSVRSEPWKRTPKPLAHSAKADPPRASSAREGPIPRSAKTRQAERDRSVASLGSEHQNPSRTARKPILPELPQRAQDRSRGAPQPFRLRTLTDS
jgi:hypothetical protein